MDIIGGLEPGVNNSFLSYFNLILEMCCGITRSPIWEQCIVGIIHLEQQMKPKTPDPYFSFFFFFFNSRLIFEAQLESVVFTVLPSEFSLI